MAKAKLPADCMPMCRTCKFQVHDKEAGYSFCHRYPPVILADSEGATYSFVPIDLQDWCGEYDRQCST